MINSATAYTYEVDNVELAVQELLEQLKGKVPPSGSRLGIVFCSYDFIDSGVIEALSEALPFDILGGTSVSQAVQGEYGALFLTLMVLYSEDCAFSTGVTDKLPDSGDINPFVASAYNKAREALPEKERLILAMPPLQLLAHSGDAFVRALSAASNRSPLFGTVVGDDSSDYRYAYAIYNGQSYVDRMPFALLSGNFSPEFSVSHLSTDTKLFHRAEVTASKGSFLLGINDKPAIEYLESVGLAANGKIRDGINSLRLIVDMKTADQYDGKPVTRTIFQTLPDGTAVCAGEVPMGSTFVIGICEKSEVLETTKEFIQEANERFQGRTALFFTCQGRRYSLGAEPFQELECFDALDKSITFLASYSAGELCPTSVTDGLASNRSHNYTIVGCFL